MNIFVLDIDPWEAASYHCDKHVIKMAVEAAQMLNTNSLFLGGDSFERDYEPFGKYKSSHINHPCTVWARQNFSNTMWLFEYGMALCVEYTERYGKIRNIQRAFEWFAREGTWPSKTKSGRTPFVLCMPDKYKIHNDPVTSYRNYYVGEKSKFAKWLKAPQPLWYTELINKNMPVDL